MITIKNDYAFSTQGVMTSSCEFTLSDKIIERIKVSKQLIANFKDIIDDVGFNVYLDINQFDSTIDDELCSEVGYSNSDYFRTDTQVIRIYDHGVYLRCYGKWDSSEYMEVEIKL